MKTKSEKLKKIKKALEAGKYKMPNSKVLADCMFFYAICAKKQKGGFDYVARGK